MTTAPRPSLLFNVPNMLCYFRVACIPFLMGLFYLDRALPGTAWPTWLAVVIFSLAAISDFLDGHIARKTGQTTLFGKFLDSSTDKMLVGVMLMLLVAFNKIDGVWIIPAVLIFLREILISGVREFLGQYGVGVAVTWLGKWKLTFQVFAIGFLLSGVYGPDLVPHADVIGKILLLVATAMTLISGWDYMKTAWTTIQKLQDDGKI